MTIDALPDLTDPGFLAGDRSGAYRQWRATAPTFPLGPPGHEAWVLTRHADVYSVLRNPSGRTQPLGLDGPSWMPEGPALRRLKANMAQTDAPVHTRLRHVVAPLFTVRQSETLREAAAAEVEAELSRLLEGDGRFDAVADLAARVPRGVLRRLIGMPDADWELMYQTQLDFLMIFSPFPLEPAQQQRLDEVAQFYFDYFERLLGRAGTPTPLVQRLLDAEAQGELDRYEVLSLMHTVLDAGFETTRTSIANAVEIFAKQPELLGAMRRDPGLIPGMVEEILRVRPPVDVMPRIVGEDYVASDGTVVPAGAQTLAVIGSANADEEVFAAPERIDPERRELAKSMTFGGGLHHCIGAPIARIQLQETLAGLARRVQRLDIVDGDAVRRAPSLIFPSLMALPVRATI